MGYGLVKKAVRTAQFLPFTRIMFYPESDKKWPKDQVWKVAFTLHFLETGPISSIKRLFTPQLPKGVIGTDPCLFRFRGHRHLWPQNLKKHGSITNPKKHDTHSLHERKCEVRTPFLTGPYPIFLSCKRAFWFDLRSHQNTNHGSTDESRPDIFLLHKRIRKLKQIQK